MEDHQGDNQRIDDLDVPHGESEDVKGGLLLPAIQAAREAARRTKAPIKDPSTSGDWIADVE